QLYPFPKQELRVAMEPFSNADEFIWCQEEPQNQGAWDNIKHRLRNLLGSSKRLYYVGRSASAAPAVGNYQVHVLQREQIIDAALNGRVDPVMNQRF
ncbi:hypothetical protein TI04_13895, partial [Achromatium sp. WMS2]